MEYEVINEQLGSVTRECNSDDPWDRDDTDTENYIQGIKLVDQSAKYHHFDGEVDFEIKPDTPYFLLCGIYSTGDSFGHDTGRIEFVDLYESEAFAEDMQKRLESHNAKNSGYSVREPQWTVKLKTESGKRFDFCVPWLGYFEALQYIEIIGVTLQD